jgi:probable rRNA maturation factor
MICVDVANEQTRLEVERPRLCAAIEAVLCAEGLSTASISLAIVDDATIQSLNRRWLNHDYPTDVLSFVLEHGPAGLDGEIIVSADTAAASAVQFGWSAADELLLYVIHGALHLVGYDDREPADREQMRLREREFLAGFGRTPRDDGPHLPGAGPRSAAGKTVEGSKP